MSSNYCTRAFGPLQRLMDRGKVKELVAQHKSDYRTRLLFTWQHLQVMVLYQFCFAKSLRDMVSSYQSSQKLHRLIGLDHLARSTFADANHHRAAAVFGDLFTHLYGKLMQVAASRNVKGKFQNVFLVDSTLIKLTLDMIHWASYRRHKAAIKLHFMLKLLEEVPAQVRLTVGRIHDVNKLAQLTYLKGMTYIFDRGYLAYDFLNQLMAQGAFFIVRLKSTTTLHVIRKIPLPNRRDYGDFTLLRDELVYVGGLIKPLAKPVRCVTFRTVEGTIISVLSNRLDLAAVTVALLYKNRWPIGVSRKGPIIQSVKDRPRLKDSSLVAREAPWRESKTAEPSDNILRKGYAQRTRLQRAVNADVASLHGTPVAETVDNVRKQQEPAETSPIRQFSPAGYQRRHGVKEDGSTGEPLDVRRGKLAEERSAITESGKCRPRHQGDGSGCSTVDERAAKRARREGPGPVSIPFTKGRQR